MSSIIPTQPSFSVSTLGLLPYSPATNTFEVSGVSRDVDKWIFSLADGVVVPLKVEWLGQDSAAAINQRQIDQAIDAECAVDSWGCEVTLIEGAIVPPPFAPLDFPIVNLHISLKDTVSSLYRRSARGIECAAQGRGDRYDPILDVFFKRVDFASMVPNDHGSGWVVQALTWVLEHLDVLKTQGFSALVVDDLLDANRRDVSEVIFLIEQIEKRGISANMVLQSPLKLIKISTLSDVVSKDQCISFVVRGLLRKRQKIVKIENKSRLKPKISRATAQQRNKAIAQ